jgi:hypothetical protein
MTNFPATIPAPQTDEELMTAIDQCFEQIERLREQMNKDQTDIERLKDETLRILAQLNAA